MNLRWHGIPRRHDGSAREHDQRRHGSNRMIVRLALLFVVASIFQNGYSMFQGSPFLKHGAETPLTSTAAPSATGLRVQDQRRRYKDECSRRRANASKRTNLESGPARRALPANPGRLGLRLRYQSDVPQPRTQLKIGVRVSANRNRAGVGTPAAGHSARVPATDGAVDQFGRAEASTQQTSPAISLSPS